MMKSRISDGNGKQPFTGGQGEENGMGDKQSKVRFHCLSQAIRVSMSGTPPEEILRAARKYYDFVAGKKGEKGKRK